MKKGCVDKRIVKTKAAIHAAFKKLIQLKEMEDITISELTNEAAITRSTFYMYYDTVSDVRDDIENEILDRLEEIMTDIDLASSFLNPYPLLKNMAEEIVMFDEKNKYILSENNSGRLLDKLSEKIANKFTEYLKNAKIGDPARGKYIAVFFASGIFSSFKLWYNHQSSLTLEELCIKMANLIKKGIAIASENDISLH